LPAGALVFWKSLTDPRTACGGNKHRDLLAIGEPPRCSKKDSAQREVSFYHPLGTDKLLLKAILILDSL
jgi:hypothetical protein